MGKPAGPTLVRPLTTAQVRMHSSFRGAEQRARNRMPRMDNDDARSAIFQKRKQEKEAKYAIFTKDWLTAADAAKTPFAEELFVTTFSPANLQKLINAAKTATENEVSESTRLLKDDYTYSLQITSHRSPNYSVHLSRM